ncbi:hypothetical protein KA005_45970 [bacterium]|nr:hypothetical protein [bacterium]
MKLPIIYLLTVSSEGEQTSEVCQILFRIGYSDTRIIDIADPLAKLHIQENLVCIVLIKGSDSSLCEEYIDSHKVSPVFQDVLKIIQKIAAAIYGKTCTGKELVTRAMFLEK